MSAQRRGGGAPTRGLQFHIPAAGNRIGGCRDSWRPNHLLRRTASGGVWKSTDSGQLGPIFDSQPAQAIGALALSVTDPKIVWAGTGEAWAIRDSDMMGNGVYKTTDAGQT